MTYEFEHARVRRSSAVQNACRSDAARSVRAPCARGRAHRGGAHAARKGLATGRVPAPRCAQAGRAGHASAGRPHGALSRHATRTGAAHQLVRGLWRVLARAFRPIGKAGEGGGSMSAVADSTQSSVEERLMPHSPEKVWRALTQSELIAAWLMPNDFKPEVGHRFTFRSDPQPGWTGITNCEVKVVEPLRRLVCTWGDGTETDSGLKTVVTWTLTPEAGGTRVRMEQSGFRPEDGAAWRGASYGWRRLVA